MRSCSLLQLDRVLLLFLFGLFVPMSFAGELASVVKFRVASFDDSLAFIKEHDTLFRQVPGVSACLSGSTADAPCAYLYGSPDGKELLVELCRDTEKSKQGLYHLGLTIKSKHYSWFDPKFMGRACVENASPGNKAEYWGLRAESSERFDSMIYKFRMNQSSGFFYIELNADGTSNLLDEKKADELR